MEAPIINLDESIGAEIFRSIAASRSRNFNQVYGVDTGNKAPEIVLDAHVKSLRYDAWNSIVSKIPPGGKEFIDNPETDEFEEYINPTGIYTPEQSASFKKAAEEFGIPAVEFQSGTEYILKGKKYIVGIGTCLLVMDPVEGEKLSGVESTAQRFGTYKRRWTPEDYHKPDLIEEIEKRLYPERFENGSPIQKSQEERKKEIEEFYEWFKSVTGEDPRENSPLRISMVKKRITGKLVGLLKNLLAKIKH